MRSFISSSFCVLALGTLSLAAPSSPPAPPGVDRRAVNENTGPMLPLHKNTSTLTLNDDFYGKRDVSYYVDSKGNAIIDGDVVYGSVDDLLANRHDPSKPRKRAFSIDAKWPDAKIKYRFVSDDVEKKLDTIISGAIKKWKDGANYLQFEQVKPNGNNALNGVLTIDAKDCGGCNANIGFSNSALHMNLQQACSSAPGSCTVNEATHEFGHVWGLLHEAQRPDRDQYVHYHCENLAPGCNLPSGKTCCDSGLPSGCCAAASNFELLSNAAYDHSGTYDIDSIMQYRANGFAKSGTVTLSAAKDGIKVPQNNPTTISKTDFDRVCKIYSAQCKK